MMDVQLLAVPVLGC